MTSVPGSLFMVLDRGVSLSAGNIDLTQAERKLADRSIIMSFLEQLQSDTPLTTMVIELISNLWLTISK